MISGSSSHGVIEELVGPWDAIVLDVDNGPDFLIHPHNRALYTEAESPGGVRSAGSWRNVGDLVPRSSSGTASRAGTHWAIGGGARHRRFSRRAQLCVRDLYGFPRAETSAGELGQNGPMTYATDAGDYRIERDTMGEVRVPAAALWKAQTQRAIDNFPISGIPINPELIAALGLIKEAAARTNAELGVLGQEYADAIVEGRERGRSEPVMMPSFHSTFSRPGQAPRAI